MNVLVARECGGRGEPFSLPPVSRGDGVLPMSFFALLNSEGERVHRLGSAQRSEGQMRLKSLNFALALALSDRKQCVSWRE